MILQLIGRMNKVVNEVSSYPLTAFEKYMLADDRNDSFPMTIPFLWTFQGIIDRNIFERAFQEAVTWHDLLRRLIQKNQWKTDDRAIAPIRWYQQGQNIADRSIDPISGPVMRVHVIESDLGGTIEIIVHHAVVDGVSLVEFCGDLFAIYDKMMESPSGDFQGLKRPRNELLPQRGILDRTIPHPVPFMTAIRVFAKETFRFLFRRAETILPNRSERPVSDSSDWRMMGQTLDLRCTVEIQKQAHLSGATVNEWAILALQIALTRWNDSLTTRPKPGWLIINMPVLLRPKESLKISACNGIGYSFLAASREGLRNWNDALKKLVTEIELVRRWKMAAMFVDGADWAAKIGCLKLSTYWVRPASAVMSHLGNPARRFRNRLRESEDGFPIAGEMELRTLITAAPLRPGTHVAGLIHQLGGRLTLCLRTVPHLFSDSETKKLLGFWVDEILAHVPQESESSGIA